MCLAVPGRIVAITDTDPLTRAGEVAFGGVSKAVNLAFVPQARVDDYVVVHAGFAISVLDRAEAERTLAALRELDAAAFAALGRDVEPS
jgi:hydrogenase expression/formation protein HypC